MDARVKPAYDKSSLTTAGSVPASEWCVMDMLSMVSGMLAAQAGNVQTQVAASIIKLNADAEKSAC